MNGFAEQGRTSLNSKQMGVWGLRPQRVQGRALAFLGFLLLAAAAPPAELYAPVPMPVPPSATRSAGGAPGAGYWQNRADYDIDARIDPATKTLTGSERLTYTNNSPDTLDVLWLQLDQNIYRRDARAAVVSPFRTGGFTEGDVIDSVAVEQDGRTDALTPLISDTRMQLHLAAPLPPHGRLVLHVAWHYTVPGAWGGRTAVTATRNGDIYEIAQWYPRMAVYDDVRGWDTAPYLGQEFYLEYGDISYAVTVPWDYLVLGSGALLNPEQVLTQTERDRLAQAATSDRTVMIRAPDEVTSPASRPTQSGTLTWRYRMNSTRDVAFAASPAFVWDAARLRLPPVAPAPGSEPGPRLAMSIYPVEGVAPDGWTRSTEYVKAVIEYFSAKWGFAYPWPNAINLGGHGAGMEYPGIVFDDKADRGRDLFWISAHELGHSWFPMIVGTNERRHGFMDEGFNTFIDVYCSDEVLGGVFGPKRDVEYAPGAGTPADQIAPLLADPDAPDLMAPTDVVPERYRHPVTYFKSAFGLVLLREQVLGPARFDAAFKRYIALWAYKHPTPSDFFRLMDSEAGEDLAWFWRGWYFNNWPLDYAVEGIAYPDGDPAHGARVTLANHGRLILPATLEIALADGRRRRLRVPAELWMRGSRVEVPVPSDQAITAVTIDPDHVLPDHDRSNDRFAAP